MLFFIHLTSTASATEATGMPGPLDGVRILEFGEIIAGPYGAMLLADMGADVIKIEPP